jgi:hypothetical protein
VARIGLIVQTLGVAIAAGAYFVVWLFRPHRGSIAGVWDGTLPPSYWVLVFAALLVAVGLASIRWRWVGIVLILLALEASWYAITNHAVERGRSPLGIPYPAAIVAGAVMSIAGLVLRALAGQPQPKAEA